LHYNEGMDLHKTPCQCRPKRAFQPVAGLEGELATTYP